MFLFLSIHLIFCKRAEVILIISCHLILLEPNLPGSGLNGDYLLTQILSPMSLISTLLTSSHLLGLPLNFHLTFSWTKLVQTH